MFQVIELMEEIGPDGQEADRTSLMDTGKHYRDLEEVKEDIAKATGAAVAEIDVDDFVRVWRNLLSARPTPLPTGPMDCNAGKSEDPMLADIAGGMTSHNFVMPLQVLGEDVCIQQNLGHLECGRWAVGTAAFLISELDDLVQQRGVFRAAKQPKPLLKDRCVGSVHACWDGAGQATYRAPPVPAASGRQWRVQCPVANSWRWAPFSFHSTEFRRHCHDFQASAGRQR